MNASVAYGSPSASRYEGSQSQAQKAVSSMISYTQRWWDWKGEAGCRRAVWERAGVMKTVLFLLGVVVTWFWRQKEKRAAEDELVTEHHPLSGPEQIPETVEDLAAAVLAKESDTTYGWTTAAWLCASVKIHVYQDECILLSVSKNQGMIPLDY